MIKNSQNGFTYLLLLFIISSALSLLSFEQKNYTLLAGNKSLLAQNIPNKKSQADMLLEQGINLLEENQLEKAKQSLEEALNIYRAIQNQQGEGDTLKTLGNVYLSL
ncbi:hypothetical protein, partial [Crocosphaera watsonii]|uniref:hypothetical protein n=1 Tax=Crocosphaera watsonii TaxID=263511 RepID=UPI00065079BA